jgi:hypothetical protein
MLAIRGSIAAPAAVLLVAGCAFAGPDWIEGAIDAGPTLSTAQAIVGVGQLQTLAGTLSAGSGFGPGVTPDLEDVYLLRITTPTSFSFTVANADFNPQLFLFNITLPGEALGLLANNDTPSGTRPVLTSPATDSTGAMVLLPGQYALGVSGFGRVPVSSTGPIFFFASSTEISGPDGPGGTNPLSGWTGNGETGTYLIELRGVDFYDVPAPASGSLLLGLAMLRRRRRQA